MTTENTTALTVQQRASVALGSSKAETDLVELAAKSKSITAITNKDGRTECHAAAMVAKEARVNIEKAGKAAREDATAFSKAVIAEEQRLVGLIAPEERRLINLRDDWDAKVKAEKEAAEAAERERIANIRASIDGLRAGIAIAAMNNAEYVAGHIKALESIDIDDSFAEFYGEAVEVKAESLAKLREIHASKVEAEALAARIKAEQEAEAKRLAEEAARLAEQKAEMERQAAEHRAAEEKRQAEERARLDAERAELDRQRRELAEAQRKQQESAIAEKARQDRIAAEEIERLDAEHKASMAASCVEESPKSETQPDLTVAGETQAPVAIQSKVTPDDRSGPRVTSLRIQISGELDKLNIFELSQVLAYCQALPMRNKLAA